jgi:hydroxymethylpyrimidine/phosphomethylpyrimidine kinase
MSSNSDRGRKTYQYDGRKGQLAALETKEDRSLLPKANAVKHLTESAITPRALTVAGYDPSSGAGMTADLEVFMAHGVPGVSAVTAMTVQSARQVTRVEPASARLLQETLDLLAEDVTIAGVKIGMLGTAELVGVVTKFLCSLGLPRERIVLDPVIRASSGAELLSAEGVRRVREELLPLVGWVTPNVVEAGVLAGVEVVGKEGVPAVAARIAELGGDAGSGLNVVVTGGHLDSPDDFLLEASGEERWFSGQRVEARGIHGTHGTGCAFSSALLCRLMRGDEKAEAVRGAKEFVVRRLGGSQ